MRNSMSINCPKCSNRLKFLDLYLFRLKDYQIKCKSCGSAYEITWTADVLGILIILLMAIALMMLSALFFKTLSAFISISDAVELVIIIFFLALISIVMIYGHAAYLGAYIKKKYGKEP